MSKLDDLKKKWNQNFPQAGTYDERSFRQVIKARVHSQTKTAMQYFWASFILQILVYALLSHVLVKYWQNTRLVVFSMFGILLYVPFTVVLLRKFKRLAVVRLHGSDASSIHTYILQQHNLLRDFFIFKRRYEWVLVPLVSAIGVFLVFALYVPDGIQAFPVGATITYLLTLLSCYWAIRSENQKSFIQPLGRLKDLLDEYEG